MASPAPRHEPREEDFSVPIGPMSFEEFLKFSESEGGVYEYADGFAYAMSPVRFVHDQITLNIATRLRTLTRGTGCRTLGEQFQVRPPDGRVWCPDAMVSCGPRPADHAVHLTDPCLVVEVLSRGTARTDHGQKRGSYQRIPILGAYLIVESTWRAVHRHWRAEDGAWRAELVTGTGAVPLPCPAGGTLTLDEIYEDVELPAEPPGRAHLRPLREEARAAYAAE